MTFEEIDIHRHRFFGTVATTLAAIQFSMIGAANAEADKTKPTALPTIKPRTNSPSRR